METTENNAQGTILKGAYSFAFSKNFRPNLDILDKSCLEN